jgi:hypothetical protein
MGYRQMRGRARACLNPVSFSTGRCNLTFQHEVRAGGQVRIRHPTESSGGVSALARS